MKRVVLTIAISIVAIAGCSEEDDPQFSKSDASMITGEDIARWDTAYAWGDHGQVGYLTDEADPVFEASDAAAITASDMTDWGTAFDERLQWDGGATNLDPAVGRTTLELGALAQKTQITNGDVDMAAAIAGTKISPNFGAQSIVAGGDAVLGGDFAYSTPRTRYLTLHASAFTPEASSTTIGSGSSPNRRYVIAGGANPKLTAPVNVPDGAVLKEWSCKVFDSSATYDWNMVMRYVPYATVVEVTMFGVFNTGGTSGGVTEVTSGNHSFVIDSQRGYYLQVYPDDSACSTSCQLYECQIRYEVSAAGF